MKRQAYRGFTLAELLIALAILGVIATFTIPKVLNASTSSQNTAIAKEAASMISGSFSAYQLENSISATTTAGAITQFMNYVRVDESTTLTVTGTDAAGNQALDACSATEPCLVLHNGAYLQVDEADVFGDDGEAVVYNVDPDGDGGVGFVSFVLVKNGRITTGEVWDDESGVFGTATPGLTVEVDDPAYIESWN